MNRRSFIYQSALFAAGVVVMKNTKAANLILHNGSDEEELLILHTNDVHSRIDPFPDNDPKFAGRGGVAKRKTIIDKFRNENKHVLLLDSGDVFQGTPYFNMFGGEPELKAMTLMGYDAATMGNHDFDNGLDGFDKVKEFAGFDFICSNYDFSQTLLNGKTVKYKTFNKGALKIGVIGIGIELKGLVNPKLFGNTIYNDPIATAEEVGAMLKNQMSCDLVICLSHLGFEYDNDKISDKVLAAKSSFIDIILGGHTHTFLPKPVVVVNARKKPVLINQVGWGGINLGYIKLRFTKNKSNCNNSMEISYIAEENREIA